MSLKVENSTGKVCGIAKEAEDHGIKGRVRTPHDFHSKRLREDFVILVILTKRGQ